MGSRIQIMVQWGILMIQCELDQECGHSHTMVFDVLHVQTNPCSLLKQENSCVAASGGPWYIKAVKKRENRISGVAMSKASALSTLE